MRISTTIFLKKKQIRHEILYPLFATLTSIGGLGEKSAKLLQNLDCRVVKDLIFHLPSNLIDRRYSPKLADAIPGRVATLKVKVIEHVPPQKKSQPYKVIAEDETEQIIISFFKAYPTTIQKNLPLGQWVAISGKLEKFNNSLQMSHPDYIVPAAQIDSIRVIEPVYPLTAGISNKMLRKWILQALARTPKLPEWLDENLLKEKKWLSFNQSLLNLHHPQYLADLDINSPERQRLAYDELLANQLTLAIARQKIKKQAGRSLKGNGFLRKKLLEILPFKLTEAQEKVLREIFADQASPYRMLRLLQGDVGCGKTIVAFFSMLNAVECGAQAAIMAPTEILAKQHQETIAPLCEALSITCALLTGKTKPKQRKEILAKLEEGKIDILIGTHALFQENVVFKDLAYAVIDEQHRFGVHQRLNFSNKGNHADILVMTATPIPRTLLLTAYGDMEYSKIDQVPEGRKPVSTLVMPVEKIHEVVAALSRKLQQGTRAYWVCPLVEESEKIDLAAAEERYESLKKYFGDQVGLVHGKMKEAEKDAVMEKFKKGEISLLVATTVIEVGVNVPEATLMIIEHAERFGLAQLHQLRGRIKRGFQASTCILLYSHPLSETSRARLNIMKETEDGFRIAEEDLDLRGGGELLGTKQSGFNTFKLADLSVHKGLLLTASQDAKLFISQDSDFVTPRGKALKNLLYLFERDEAVKTYNQ